MEGILGKMAIIDLTSRTVQFNTIPEKEAKTLIGGNGFAIKLFLDWMKPGIDPFSPENILFFGTGPATGTSIPGSDRAYVAGKSPLTGLFFDSTLGGRFASSIKQAGYDAVIITGKAEMPIYIVVSSSGVKICDARQLMGRSPSEVRTILSSELHDFEVCTIGIAGENMVRYASIMHPRDNGRPGVAGRGGLGAVMGAKNMKALVVQRGRSRIKNTNSSQLFRSINYKIRENLKQMASHLTTFGTASGLKLIASAGALMTRNLQSEVFEYADNISGETLRNKYYRHNISCHGCPVACGKLCELDGKLVKSPEYETLAALGSMVGIGDFQTILRANFLCDEYGLDTISAGDTIAFAIECFENGLLSPQKVGGRTLKFGDNNIVVDLISDIAHRRGCGDLMAEGTKHMAQVLGDDAWKYAYQVKGLELAGHSPRVVKTLAIGYATNTRGGSHQDARVRYTPDMDTYDGKVEMAIATQNLTALGDSLLLCRFVMEAGLGITLNDNYCALLNALTGEEQTINELNETGERIVNMERIFNVKEGVQRNNDTLPYKVIAEEIPEGPHKGHKIPPDKLQEMLDEYYQLRGWNMQGIPKKSTLERLGITT